MSWFGGREAARKAKAARSGARRRAREAAAPGSPDRELSLDEVYARDNGYCYLCKLPVPREQASIEHVVPLSEGGSRRPSNTRLAHRRCNSKKGARTEARKKGLRRSMLRPKPKSKIPEGEDVF